MEEEKKLNNVKLILIVIVLISVTLYIVLNNLENNNETNTSSEVDNTNIVDDSAVPSVGAPIMVNVTNETSYNATNITKQEDTASRTDIQRHEETATEKSDPVKKNESEYDYNITR
jgi:hypothetical protein